MLYAFIVGLILSHGAMNLYVSSKGHGNNNRDEEADDTLIGLHTRLVEARQLIVNLEEQRDRAFSSVLAILVACWFAFVYYVVNSRSSLSLGYGYNVKTEL